MGGRGAGAECCVLQVHMGEVAVCDLGMERAKRDARWWGGV